MTPSKRVVAFDTETDCFAPGYMAPHMVCMTWRGEEDDVQGIVHANDPGALSFFKDCITDPDVLLVGHHVAYDLAVCAAKWPDLLQEIFLAYADDRITCTKIRQQLIDIASGQFQGYADDRGVWRKNAYDLGSVAKKMAGRSLKKDGWRRRYGEFMNTPISGWEALAEQKRQEAAKQIEAGSTDKDLLAIVEGKAEEIILYPLDDARSTLEVYQSQETVGREHGIFADEFRQARAAWWLHLTSVWGIRTHGPGVEELRRNTEAEIARLERDLVHAGLVRKNGSRDTKMAATRMLAVCGWQETAKGQYKESLPLNGVRLPLRSTAGGGVSLDRDACKASGDPLLKDYGDLVQLKAVLSKDLPMLEAGTVEPIHCRYDLAETGRTTCSKPNLQNLRRIKGIRETFLPRQGKVYAQADYPQLELRTLAQACMDLLGTSALADMLNSGKDPHLAFAAQVLGLSYEKAKANKKRPDVDAMRQIAKVFNFGSPGGMGAEALCTFARKTYDVHLTPEDVRGYKVQWFETFPEMREYFAHVGQLTNNPGGRSVFRQLRSNRIRGGAGYTSTCNSFFQGLGADIAKSAGFLVSRACYAEPSSPLYGSRIVAFVHDELIAETDDGPGAHAAAVELGRLMLEAANVWLPDVPFSEVPPLLMRVWSKDAREVFDAKGCLIPWAPMEEVAA